jgi:hypothetical protein
MTNWNIQRSLNSGSLVTATTVGASCLQAVPQPGDVGGHATRTKQRRVLRPGRSSRQDHEVHRQRRDQLGQLLDVLEWRLGVATRHVPRSFPRSGHEGRRQAEASPLPVDALQLPRHFGTTTMTAVGAVTGGAGFGRRSRTRPTSSFATGASARITSTTWALLNQRRFRAGRRLWVRLGLLGWPGKTHLSRGPLA